MLTSRGLSLLELVVVLGIIGVLAAIGFTLLRPHAARHAAIALASELTAARLRALASGAPTALQLSDDQRQVVRTTGSPWDDAPTTCADGQEEGRVDLGRYPRVTVTSGLAAGIVWFPTGWGRTCDGGGVYNGRIVVTGARSSYAVVVSSAGRVRWERLP